MKLLFLTALAFVSSLPATSLVPVSRSSLAGMNGFTFYNPYCGYSCFRSFYGFTLPCSTVISAGEHMTADETVHNLAKCPWCMHLYCQDDSPTFAQVDTNVVLNMIILRAYEKWNGIQGTLWYFFRETALESYFGLSICLTAFGLPVALIWLGYLPFMASASQLIKPFLYPSIFGTYHDRSIPFYLGNAPTVSQTFYVAVVVVLNIVFLAKTKWYANRHWELFAYFMWLTGVLAFCNMPVLFLFSSRNNILLWLTNWSHSTYMLLHRWIACLFLFQTLLYSIFALVLVPILRQQAYELFLITHIVFDVICIVGCWYHVYIRYENTFWLRDLAVCHSSRLVLWPSDLRGPHLEDGQNPLCGARTLCLRILPDPQPFPTVGESPYRTQAKSETSDVEKNHAMAVGSGTIANGIAYTNSGLALLVTLLEGPYPTGPTKAVLESDRLCHSNVKLFYGTKAADECLINSLSAVLDEIRQKDITINWRLNIDALLRGEASLGWSEITVVVCGPAGMCDDVRAAVSRLGKEKACGCVFELEVEAFLAWKGDVNTGLTSSR
ncbi:ferric-chelate reductase [Xylaria acuta]|nr:ferric-chelate reductase [Xylaria acuta]